MIASTARSALQLLDEVQSLPQLDALGIDAFTDAVARELGSDGNDAPLRAMLAAIDAFAVKAMRIRVGGALASDTSLQPAFRTYLAGSVLSYAGDLDTLRDRVTAVAARVDPEGAADTAAAVATAAGEILALHGRLRAVVLAHVKVPPPVEEAEPDEPPSREELIELD
jgi:hypothetical protein